MAQILNLRQARKAKARAEKDLQAASNRAKFGRKKPERDRDQAEAERAARDLDAKRRDP